jgi:hypothetical protein
VSTAGGARFRLETRHGGKTAVLGVAAWLALAVSAAGQANDPLTLEPWQWDDEPPAARTSGLGGASVSVVDGAYTYVSNPAALSLVRSRQFTASNGGGSLALKWWPGNQDRAVTVGAYFTRPLAQDVFLDGARLREGSLELGSLSFDVYEAGGGGAVQFGRLRVGAGVGIGYLSARGSYSRRLLDAPEESRTGVQANNFAAKGVLGVLIDAWGQTYSYPLVRVGASVRRRSAWRMRRTDLTLPLTPPADTPERQVSLREPESASLGLSVELQGQWLLTAEAELASVAAVDAAEPRRIRSHPNQLDWRAGLEKEIVVRLRARAGAHWQRRRYLIDTGEDYEVGVVRGQQRHLLLAGGLSWSAEVLKTKTLRADVDVVDALAGSFRIVAGFVLDF